MTSTIPPAEQGPAPPRRRRLVVVLLLALVLVGSAAVTAWWRTRSQAPVPPPVPEGLSPKVASALNVARKEAIENPRSGTAWGLLGLSFTAHGFDDQAAECFREAHRLDKDDDRWPYMLALYYLNDG